MRQPQQLLQNLRTISGLLKLKLAEREPFSISLGNEFLVDVYCISIGVLSKNNSSYCRISINCIVSPFVGFYA